MVVSSPKEWMRLGFSIDLVFDYIFSKRVRQRIEDIFLLFAILGFLVHLLLIFLNEYGIINISTQPDNFFEDPISAIYTPFSFILVYEVYLLVYYLPESFTTSVRKQYEIISLIVIRRIFKDISKLELKEQWFENAYNVLFTADLIGFVLLFLFILFFNKLQQRKPLTTPSKKLHKFIKSKKRLSLILLPSLAIMAVYSLAHWIYEVVALNKGIINSVSDINKIFYNEFFTLLILVDVLILLISFRYTEKYSQLIRNSGFIISTILIRISFSAEGILNIIIIIVGVGFGIIILRIYNAIEEISIVRDQN